MVSVRRDYSSFRALGTTALALYQYWRTSKEDWHLWHQIINILEVLGLGPNFYIDFGGTIALSSEHDTGAGLRQA